MPDDVARAVGAGGRTVNIGGKECTVRPLSIKELTEVERECLTIYKRNYLKTFSDNADLLPKGEGIRMLQEKMEEVAKWDVGDLPSKYAYDPGSIKINRKLKKWLTEAFDMKEEIDDERMKRLVVAALDQMMLSTNKYQRMIGEPPVRAKVGYVNWWITGSYEGMITFVWVCFAHNGVTKEEVATELGRNQQMLAEITQEIEQLSAPAAGNGSG